MKKMKKMKLNIQHFAAGEKDVMTPSEVLNKIMGALPIEEWAEEMDILQNAIANQNVDMIPREDYEKLTDSYNKLTEKYKERFGQLTEEKIENTLGNKESEIINYRDLDMGAGFYGATE